MALKIEKEKHRMTILLNGMKITGFIHTMPRARLTDILNSNQIKEFLPITDATIEIYATGEKKDVDLVEINKDEIYAIYPEEPDI